MCDMRSSSDPTQPEREDPVEGLAAREIRAAVPVPSRSEGGVSLEDEFYNHFLEHAEQIRIKFPIVTDPWPPHERDLPSDDGMPVDSQRHWMQRTILWQTLEEYWRERERGYVAANMGVYFNIDHDRRTYDLIDPDFFVAVNADKRMRDCWVEWDEPYPIDVVIELMSPSTYQRDKVDRFRVYQDILRVPEYFWYDPFTEEFAGFRLQNGLYEAIAPDAAGDRFSEPLGLFLGVRETLYLRDRASYLRLIGPDGVVLPTADERIEVARQRTEAARARTQAARAQVGAAERATAAARRRIAEIEAEMARLRERLDESDA